MLLAQDEIIVRLDYTPKTAVQAAISRRAET
jgi:hypothetical protein